MEGRGHLFLGPVVVRYVGLVAQSGNTYNLDIDQVGTVTHAWHYVATYSMFRLVITVSGKSSNITFLLQH